MNGAEEIKRLVLKARNARSKVAQIIVNDNTVRAFVNAKDSCRIFVNGYRMNRERAAAFLEQVSAEQ